MKQEYNTHHILAKASQDFPGTNHPDNKVELPIRRHRALHDLFDLSPPHEQINRILTISETVWQTDQFHAIDQLLKSFKGEYYRRHCIRDRGTNFKK